MVENEGWVRFFDLGMRDREGRCELPTGEYLMIDDDTWGEWEDLGYDDYELHMVRAVGPQTGSRFEWTVDKKLPLRALDARSGA